MKYLLQLIIFTPFTLFSQVIGSLTDDYTKEPIYGAKIISQSGERALSSVDGNFKLNISTLFFVILM